MENNKPDLFGKYAKVVERIHRQFIAVVSARLQIDIQKMEMPIYQCVFIEYVDMKHDDNYTHLLCGVAHDLMKEDVPPKDRIMIASVNNEFREKLLSENIMQELLVNDLAAIWARHAKVLIWIYGLSDTLVVNHDDVIQTVHFLFQGKQIFKVLYAYRAFSPLLNTFLNE